MIKKIGIVLFLVLAAQYAGRPQGAAPTILPGLAFADSYTQDGKPCPPECVSDSMEIVTWYPSPWNSYDELRSNRIVVGGGDEELNPPPPPKGVITFLPLNYDPVTDSSGTVSKGSLYYYESFTGDSKKFKYTDDGSTWKDLGGGGVSTIQIAATAIYPNSISGYAKITVDGVDYALPYYTYYPPLINNAHTGAQCLSVGGSIVAAGGGNSFCKFSGSSCPSGWSRYLNWSTTIGGGTFCNENGDFTGGAGCSPQSNCCSLGDHPWSNIALERCTHKNSQYCTGCCDTYSNTATITEIGCY